MQRKGSSHQSQRYPGCSTLPSHTPFLSLQQNPSSLHILERGSSRRKENPHSLSFSTIFSSLTLCFFTTATPLKVKNKKKQRGSSRRRPRKSDSTLSLTPLPQISLQQLFTGRRCRTVAGFASSDPRSSTRSCSTLPCSLSLKNRNTTKPLSLPVTISIPVINPVEKQQSNSCLHPEKLKPIFITYWA